MRSETIINEMAVLPPNAVFEKNGQVVTTSMFIAETFGKRHDRVLRAIKELDCPEEFRRPNFGEATYIDAQGKPRPMVEITKDGIVFLVMGFTGHQAARAKVAYIERFNQMEQALLQQRFASPATPKVEVDAVDYYKMRAELAELKLETAQPRRRVRRDFTEAEKTIMLAMNARGKTPRQIAREIGRSYNSVDGWLRSRR
jgi:Rha family phage regulatory protein